VSSPCRYTAGTSWPDILNLADVSTGIGGYEGTHRMIDWCLRIASPTRKTIDSATAGKSDSPQRQMILATGSVVSALNCKLGRVKADLHYPSLSHSDVERYRDR
jgi:hypothetical protein